MPLNPDFMGRAYSALKSELGRQACAEGWGIALFEHVAQHGERPDYFQQNELRAHAELMEERKLRWPAFARDAHDRRAQRLERIANGNE